jgi:hypothetical protein
MLGSFPTPIFPGKDPQDFHSICVFQYLQKIVRANTRLFADLFDLSLDGNVDHSREGATSRLTWDVETKLWTETPLVTVGFVIFPICDFPGTSSTHVTSLVRELHRRLDAALPVS